jgi:molecular chaperone GrpE
MAKKVEKASSEKASTAKKIFKKGKSEDKTKKELDKLNLTLGEEKDKYLRLFAEFENYKKRTTKERIELFKTASQDVLLSMIPVLDDFNRANQQLDNDGESNNSDGFKLIFNKFDEALKSNGLIATETQKGDQFDGEIHEAITQIPASSDSEKGKIIDIIEVGYQLGDKIIRYPKVVVGQ